MGTVVITTTVVVLAAAQDRIPYNIRESVTKRDHLLQSLVRPFHISLTFQLTSGVKNVRGGGGIMVMENGNPT